MKMNIEKWLKLILIIVIFAMILFLFSSSPNGKQKTSEIKKPNLSVNSHIDKHHIDKHHIDELHNDESKIDKKTKDKISKCMSCTSTQSGSNRCKSTGPLLPVMEPRFNMREICKQSVLLEDHLFQKEKRCHDCIIKHFLTIEGLAEEAITLDKEHKYPELNDIPPKIRKIEKKYIDNYKDPKQPAIIAQELREIRKNMMQDCFDAF
jgi:hypothetical protein